MLDYLIDSLKIEKVQEIMPHEQTIPEHLERLKKALGASKKLIDPLIIDRKSKVILDGNHRKKVLENLNCELAVCQEVEYRSKEIRLGGWFPVVEGRVDEIVRQFGSLDRVDFDTGIREVQRLGGAFLAVGNGECFLFPSIDKSLDSVLKQQSEILKKMSKEIRYIADDLAEDYSEKGVVFYRKVLTKDDVLRTARKGDLLPPKSTRHLISRRIIGLEVPLGWLNLPDKEAENKLGELIADRYNNNRVRYYAEPIILMNY